MSARSRLLEASLLGTGYTIDSGKPARLRLGPIGRCPSKPTLVITVADDSGSVTAPGGADPISNRYEEMRLAFKAVAGACTCGKELAAVVHFDSPYGDVPPQRLNRRGLQALGAGLRVPLGGAGTSDLLPALVTARTLAETHPAHELVLVIFSDFELTDSDPAAVIDALETFPGEVHACFLGGSQTSRLPGVDRVTTASHEDLPGIAAQAILGGLTLHRKGLNRGGS